MFGVVHWSTAQVSLFVASTGHIRVVVHHIMKARLSAN